MRVRLLIPTLLLSSAPWLPAEDFATKFQPFLEKNCLDCHDADTKKGGLDLDSLKSDFTDKTRFAAWVKVFDRVESGEMPPKKRKRPDLVELAAFDHELESSLVTAEKAQFSAEGRATERRLNRYEYENTLRDALHAPWLQVKDSLPEDGESHRFNKVGDALDVSHVQIARYMAAADYALHEVLTREADKVEPKTVRYYARDQGAFTGHMKFSVFNQSPERATFPMLGDAPQPDVRAGNAPMTVGAKDPETREKEAVGLVASTYEPIEVKFNKFQAPSAGHYKLRFNAFSVWVGPGKPSRWWTPDLDTVTTGRRPEPITIYSEIPPRLLRWLGTFDVSPEPSVHELDVWLLAGETIRPDAARLFRSRPPNYHNPLAEEDGQPGVAYRWMEVEGPLPDDSLTIGRQILFGDLPVTSPKKGVIEVAPKDPDADAERLLRNFVQHTYREPVPDPEQIRFLPVIKNALKSGSNFADAMIAGYTAVLCSPEFVCLHEAPGPLDDYALASRLSYFLWNSPPDEELHALAATGRLHEPAVLQAQTDRMLKDRKSRRFINAFLDYWLDLRKMTNTAPDSTMYPDYYLDDLLVESAEQESQLFFGELIKDNLPVSNVVNSNFTFLNERLARHYGLAPVEGVALRRVELPKDCVRGGLMTQASVLKVTANGTNTSPVQRGAWIMERILGKAPPPPPPSVPAIEPDIRGATTIRQQLDKHRTLATCAACHAKIDPAGFALESFDVMGGWRGNYRAHTDKDPEPGVGHNGQKFTFHDGPVVDASGELPDGRKFADVRELKRVLLDDDKQIARNLVQQLTVYATGAPVRFADRAQVGQILDHAQASHYGVRTLVCELVQSDLFKNK